MMELMTYLRASLVAAMSLLVIIVSDVRIANVEAALSAGESRWQMAQSGLPGNGVATTSGHVAMSGNGMTILAGVGHSGLGLSRDGGRSWRQFKPPGSSILNWGRAGLSNDGQVILVGSMQSNEGAFRSLDGGESWAQVATTGGAGVSLVSADGSIMMRITLGGRIFRSVDGGDSWSESQPAGDANASWFPGAMSEDGQVVLAGVSNGRLYRTVNGGDSWTEVQPAGNINANWYSTGMSDDGQVMLVGRNSSRLYRSINGGNSWSEVRPAGNVNRSWRIAEVSVDGTSMLAGVGSASNGRMYRSIDSGDVWVEAQPAGNINAYYLSGSQSSDGQVVFVLATDPLGRHYLSTDGGVSWSVANANGLGEYDVWRSMALSGDGLIGLAGIGRFDIDKKGRLYRTDDAGQSWIEVRPMGDVNVNWSSVDISSDGQNMMAAADYGGRLYRSMDSGDTWIEVRPAGDTGRDWSFVSISADGQAVFAGAYGSRLYHSVDGGDTWTELQPAGNSNMNWYAGVVSGDGEVLLVASNSGRLYRSVDGGGSWVEAQPAGNVDRAWYQVDVSEDGQTLLTISNWGTYLSTDAGQTWSQQNIEGSTNWTTGQISADGNTLLLAYGHSLNQAYSSYNRGQTWSRVPVSSDGSTKLIAMSNSGKRLLIAQSPRVIGPASLVLRATLIPTAPILTIADQTSFISSGQSAEVSLTGLAPTESAVEVEVHSTPQSGLVLADSEGIWTWLPPLGLSIGSHSYRARVVDGDIIGDWSDWIQFNVLADVDAVDGNNNNDNTVESSQQQIPATGYESDGIKIFGLSLVALGLTGLVLSWRKAVMSD